MNVAINGFGRIGRTFFRIAGKTEGVNVVYINDIGDAPTLAHLLKYDSTYGVWDKSVQAVNGGIEIEGTRIPVTSEKDPGKLPWKANKVDVVLESTGKFRKREDAQAHLDAGARKVLISAPGKSPLDGDFIMGVNEDQYDPKRHDIISIGSCTTNCLAPLAKVVHEEFTIEHGLMTTVHAYTSSQQLVDGPHKDLRRARAAATNIIPTTTGAAQMIGKIITDLDGKLDGMAVRVPVVCGSIVDLTCHVKKSTSADKVTEAMQRWSGERMKGVLKVADAPIVSSDIVGSSYSAIYTQEDTIVKGSLVKVLAWYDNEWGFSHRLLDMVTKMV